MTGPGQPMYAIAGGKGGCGKTTTVCGLARGLVRAGRHPIVVDADVDMPDLHDRVGADLEPGLDALGTGVRLDAVLQDDHDLPGVDLVARGSSSGAAAGPSDGVRPGLDRLTPVERPVLVDCPAGAGPDVAAALGTAERAVVVSTDTRESLEDAAKTAAMSRALETPVACLCLRESPPAKNSAGRTPGQDTTGDDERLRRLVGAPTVVRVPFHRGSAAEPRERPTSSVSCRTAAVSRYDRLAGVTVLERHSSGGSGPLRGDQRAR